MKRVLFISGRMMHYQEAGAVVPVYRPSGGVCGAACTEEQGAHPL